AKHLKPDRAAGRCDLPGGPDGPFQQQPARQDRFTREIRQRGRYGLAPRAVSEDSRTGNHEEEGNGSFPDACQSAHVRKAFGKDSPHPIRRLRRLVGDISASLVSGKRELVAWTW